jgi:predicted nucleic acid-binding protein
VRLPSWNRYVSRHCPHGTRRRKDARRMAEEKVVLSDASPLIGLAVADAFDILRRLFKTVSITDAVRREVTARKTLPGAREVKQGMDDGWIERVPDPRKGLLFPTLGRGETTTLNVALHAGPQCLVLMDDAAARAEARARGIAVTGTAGVLLVARRRKLIPAVRPRLEKLFAAGFRMSPGVIGTILEEAGES